MRVLDLFSGIGGLAIGLERAGFKTAAFCEADAYCRAVLASHWRGVPIFDDVRTLTAARLAADGIAVDAICGGFPCQDISFAGSGAGLEGERSGLWVEFARLIGELRPNIVIVENVAALLNRGIGAVLGDLARLGYDAEWSVISACSVGAPHMRRRLFIVAYPDSIYGRSRLWDSTPQGYRTLQALNRGEGPRASYAARLADKSALYGGANGIPNGRERNKAIGNAVVPDVGELIGRAIMGAMRE